MWLLDAKSGFRHLNNHVIWGSYIYIDHAVAWEDLHGPAVKLFVQIEIQCMYGNEQTT